MATYLALMRWTKEGIERIKEQPIPLGRCQESHRARRRKASELLHVDGSIRHGGGHRGSRRRDLRPREPFSCIERRYSHGNPPRLYRGRIPKDHSNPFPNLSSIELLLSCARPSAPHACSWCCFRPCGGRGYGNPAFASPQFLIGLLHEFGCNACKSRLPFHSAAVAFGTGLRHYGVVSAVWQRLARRSIQSAVVRPDAGLALSVIMGSAFAVVHHAESLAVRLGGRLGTLVLTLSVIGSK